jgi:hypothetical protein
VQFRRDARTLGGEGGPGGGLRLGVGLAEVRGRVGETAAQLTDAEAARDRVRRELVPGVAQVVEVNARQPGSLERGAARRDGGSSCCAWAGRWLVNTSARLWRG